MSMQRPTKYERTEIIAHAKRALVNEQYTSLIYARLADMYQTSDSRLSTRLASLAKEEATHADFWMAFLTRRGVQRSVDLNPYRTVVLTYLYKLVGIGLTLKMLEIGERDAIEQYALMLKSADLSEDEKQGLLTILADELKHEEDFEEYEARFKFFISKVAIFNTQLSNGLVAIISVATGFAGVYTTNIDVIIPSMIVGVTGALSTVTGFYFFGRTQNLVKQGILARLRVATEAIPQLFTDRVRKYMQKKNLSAETTQAIVTEATRNRMYLRQVIAEEEYGITEESLGNPLNNALYAGLFRVMGTILPLTPYVLGLSTDLAIPISILITVTLLAINGFFVALAAELDVKQKVMELTLSGVILAVLAFAIGKLTTILRSVM
jgi:VIT1/CCC1 family predicted Fe2+/Mn2+ transporter